MLPQTDFYLRPSIGSKVGISSSAIFNYDRIVVNPVQDYHYSHSTLATRPSILFGLNMGFKIKKRLLIELGINNDIANSSYKINVAENLNKIVDGKRFGRIVLQGSWLLNPTATKHKIYFDFGFGVTKRFKNSFDAIKIEQAFFSTNTYGNNVDYTSTLYAANTFKKFTLLGHLGITDDIYYNDKHLFSISLFFSRGKRNISGISTDVNIINTNGFKTYQYVSISKGSGIYLTISKKLIFKSKSKTKK
jgi:hypothetical protein